MEHIWRVTEEHLALLDDPSAPSLVRTFARDVVMAGLLRGPCERTLGRTFEVLRGAVDREDLFVLDITWSIPDWPSVEALRGSLTRLAERGIRRRSGPAVLESLLGAMLLAAAPVPMTWMRALLEATSDAELEQGRAWLFHDWLEQPTADRRAFAEMLRVRPALAAASARRTARASSRVQ